MYCTCERERYLTQKKERKKKKRERHVSQCVKYRIRCPPFLFPTPRSISHGGTVLSSLGLELVDATLESRIVESVVVAGVGRWQGYAKGWPTVAIST